MLSETPTIKRRATPPPTNDCPSLHMACTKGDLLGQRAHSPVGKNQEMNDEDGKKEPGYIGDPADARPMRPVK